MAKDNTKETGNDKLSKASVDNKLAAVRDLIFGENIQQYEINFDEVYGRIDALKNESNKNLADAVARLESKIEAFEKSKGDFAEKLTNDLDKKLAKLDEAKADRKKLGKALEKIALMLQG